MVESVVSVIDGIFASAAGGGLIGLLGSVVGYFAKKAQAKFEMEAKDKERAHELALQRLQMERGDRETENELAIIQEKGAADVRVASYGINMVQGELGPWTRAIRALFRPALTIWLWIMIPVVLCALRLMLSAQNFALVVTVSLITYIVESLVFTASTATVWWFGDRAFAPPGMKNR